MRDIVHGQSECSGCPNLSALSIFSAKCQSFMTLTMLIPGLAQARSGGTFQFSTLLPNLIELISSVGSPTTNNLH
jgi:hypothetical protein